MLVPASREGFLISLVLGRGFLYQSVHYRRLSHAPECVVGSPLYLLSSDVRHCRARARVARDKSDAELLKNRAVSCVRALALLLVKQ